MPRFRQQEVVAMRRIALTGRGTAETAGKGLEKGARQCLLNPAISILCSEKNVQGLTSNVKGLES
jgi:hypothetical protein